MKIGIVGYQGAGKSSLFKWLTGVEPDPSLSHTSQLATTAVPDERLDKLSEIYRPKKITRATIQIIDTPGLSRDQEGNANKLAALREAGCLIIVVGAFAGADPMQDLAAFEEDLLFADLSIVLNRVEKLRDSVKRPKPTREQELQELEALEPIVAHLEQGRPLHEFSLNDRQSRAIRSFQLLTEKTRRVVVNLADDQSPQVMQLLGQKAHAFAIPMQIELDRMSQEERHEFCMEMGIQPMDRDALLREFMLASQQMVFFTAGEKEVRSWLIPIGATAEMAADSIHSDLARGFVRAERMTCDDLFRVGSEREIKVQNLMHKEHKDYVIQDGDILHILANT
ncbi:MAG TPA: DUF933 domain-containing protein [Pirellulaceae bacterium]|nr:DUF933 domain-containing protein [Pirellulaceae bacterium]HMO93587.1 DUF933 domain-containing protein [Pirellulaceae bacterium]HMP70511.1 DUF933 domain-containing protein [Pirellulaceae bacterium]